MKSFSQTKSGKGFIRFRLMLKSLIILFITWLVAANLLIAGDVREFEIGANVKKIPNQRYVNIKCLQNNLKIKYWKNFKRCKKEDDGLFYVSFEYNDKYAYNENFGGTQVAGHPVVINIGVNSSGLLSKINLKTNPKAPFYFKKQAHLFWMRIYSKYGSKNWSCTNFEKEDNHIEINKKYVNRSCNKIYKDKQISYQTEFYFINDRKKENLVSRTRLSISRHKS